jgi:hypothetical protein
LNLILETCDCSIAIDDQSGSQQILPNHALGAENDGEIRLSGGRRNPRPRAFQERWIGRRYRFPGCAVTRNKTLRETDDAGARGESLSNGLFGQGDRLLWSCREPDIRQRESKRAHI